MIGSVCEAMSSGISARRTAAEASIEHRADEPDGDRQRESERRGAQRGSPLSTRSARLSHVASATADGAGSTSGPIALTVTYSCHPASSSATTAAQARAAGSLAVVSDQVAW